MLPGRRYRFEAPANPVEREQRARRDAEIGSVKDELALPFALGNPWEGAQIGETLDDRSQGETLDVVIGRRASRLDSRRCGTD
jgi:hypothetical protein